MERVAPNGTGLLSATIGATVTLPPALIATLPVLAANEYVVATITSETTPTSGVGSVVKLDTINLGTNQVNIVASLAETVAGKTLNSNLALIGTATSVNIVFGAVATAEITRPEQRTVNNASFLTEAQITQATTNIIVPVAQRALFLDVDNLGTPAAMYRLTLDDGANNEIVFVVGYDPATGSMELARAAEGTLANIFAIGTKAELRLTAGLLEKKTLPKPESVYSTGTDVTIRGIAKTVINVAGGGVKIGDVSATNAALNGIAIGTLALSNTDNIAIGHNTYAPSLGKTVVVGTLASAASIRTVIVGQSASSTLERCVAVGYKATCVHSRSVAIGSYAKALMYKGTAVGDSAEARDKWAVAIGQNCYTSVGATDAVTIGQFSDCRAKESVSLGGSATVNAATAIRAIALGFQTKVTKPRTISTGHSRPMLYYLNAANNAPASALEANTTSLVAGSTIYVGSGVGMGIIPDDVTVHITNVIGVATTAPVFTLDTQAVSSTVEDNELPAALTAPVNIGTLGANILSDNDFDKLTTGFPANKPVKGVRLTLTTPPVGITAWKVHLMVRGVLLSIV